MASLVFDSAIYRDAFGTPEMRDVFSDESTIARQVAVEIALARVQGRLGVIPAEAAADIAGKCDAKGIDLNALKKKTDVVGYPIVGLVAQLAKQCGDAGRYLHWGATTQDIIDTALVLQIKAALDLVAHEIAAIDAALARLARTHKMTVMAGRTHLQQALPITFGYKAAVWLSMMQRHRQRLEELKPRVLVGQFAGAAGTLASLRERGLEVSDALMDELGLGKPDIPWHVARDGVTEAVSYLGLVTGTLAKIATDVMLMMQTEIGEAFEPFEEGRGSSSTMPQKRNPIACEFIIGAAKVVRQQVGLMLDGMVADHERATGPWQAEWVALPQAFIAASGALKHARLMLQGLVVEPAKMRKNLDVTGGLIMAEAVMMAFAAHVGRQESHHIVYAACRKALEAGTTLADELANVPEVTRHFSREQIAQLTDPASYLGSVPQMVDRVLARSKA
ncbi:MAG: 3-carboxy-cis,cis-muconate cycloisomerase [Hyphomicrobiales bacterium]|nr:MAG: 3-carboxy-cis,cis-muconate cycloisomerase [Hyphomicrobiales bacterium]